MPGGRKQGLRALRSWSPAPDPPGESLSVEPPVGVGCQPELSPGAPTRLPQSGRDVRLRATTSKACCCPSSGESPGPCLPKGLLVGGRRPLQERLTRAGAPLQSPSGFPQLCSCASLPTGLPFSSPAASSPGRRAREGSCSGRERHSHLGCQPARLCLPPAPGAGSTAPLHLVSVTSSSAGVLAHGLWAAGGQLESGPLPRHSLPEAARGWRTKAHSETTCILDPSDGPLPLHSCRPLWELADAYLVSDLSRPTASVFFSGGCGMRRGCCSNSTGAT